MDFADLRIPLYVGAKQHGRRGGEIILHVDVGCPHLTARRRSPPPLVATREQRLNGSARLCLLCGDDTKPKGCRSGRRGNRTLRGNTPPSTLEEWLDRQNDRTQSKEGPE
jgi:hypothetical protein